MVIGILGWQDILLQPRTYVVLKVLLLLVPLQKLNLNGGARTRCGHIDIDVTADADRDGIPDEDELKHACLAVGHDDSNSDPDGDGLSSRLEVMLGTNPCVADSDGIPDGEELKAGSDPAVRSSVPLPQRIFVADRLASLGTCGSNVREQRRPVIADPGLSWEVRTDSDWLLAERPHR